MTGAEAVAAMSEGIIWGIGALLPAAGVAWAAFRFGAGRRDREVDAVRGEMRTLRDDVNRRLDRLHADFAWLRDRLVSAGQAEQPPAAPGREGGG